MQEDTWTALRQIWHVALDHDELGGDVIDFVLYKAPMVLPAPTTDAGWDALFDIRGYHHDSNAGVDILDIDKDSMRVVVRLTDLTDARSQAQPAEQAAA
jgi:hypothetical protein